MITPEQRTALIKSYLLCYVLRGTGTCIERKLETSKHGYLLGWFNKTYVKPGIFPPIIFKMLRDAYDRRIEADYELGPLPKSEDIPGIMEEMNNFIAQIETFLTKL